MTNIARGGAVLIRVSFSPAAAPGHADTKKLLKKFGALILNVFAVAAPVAVLLLNGNGKLIFAGDNWMPVGGKFPKYGWASRKVERRNRKAWEAF